MPQPKQRLRNLKVREVSLVDDGDNPGARFVLFKRRTEKQPTAGAVHVDSTERDRKPSKRPRRGRGKADGENKIAKASATTSSADGHSHRLEFPDGPLAAGRFITNTSEGHTHDLTLPDLLPGESAEVETGTTENHTHTVQVEATESVINRRTAKGDQAMKWFEKLTETIRDWSGKEPDADLEKRLFEDIREERMTEQVADALMSRVNDLAQSVREIMFGPESMEEDFNPQSSIEESLKQFAEAMDGELAGIFAGQIAKRFHRGDDDGAPTDEEIAGVLSDLITPTGEPAPGATRKESGMDLSKLSKEDRTEVEAALEKAGTVEDLTTKLAASEEEVVKLKGDGEKDPDPLESLPEDVRKVVDPVLKAAQEEAAGAKEENAAMRKRLDKIEADTAQAEFAKGVGDLTGLPQKREDLVELLWTMTDADARSTMQKNLEAAAAAARRGQVFGEIGSGMGGDAGTAYAKIEAAAEEIRKGNPKLTEAQARAQAMNDHPDLYDAYLEEERAPIN